MGIFPLMNKIILKKQLSEKVWQVEIEAPLIAAERRAGQFIILQTDADRGERVPLTIADASVEKGTITLIFQVVGKTTEELSRFQVGDELPVLVGPLGRPTHIENFGHVACVGGGIGVAPLHPIVQALKAAGNKLTVISGARSRDLLILQDEMEALADRHIVVTDDGTAGRKGRVTDPLKELCELPEDERPDLAIVIGPPIMMKFCAETTRPYGVKTVASLNTIMVDGTGMCGGCRVTVGGKTKFVCVDGPEFDAHEVDFDNMMARLGAFRDRERQAHDHYCNLQRAFDEKRARQ